MRATKQYILAGAAVIAATVAVRHFTRPVVEAQPVPQEANGGRLTRRMEGAEIFQRAFWRRPTDADKILHAERREWIGGGEAGVRKWEWFMALEPSGGLVEDLKRRFSLEARPLVLEPLATAPDWFRGALKKDATVVAAADGSLQLILLPGGKQILATGVGAGFAPAAVAGK